MKFIDFLNTFDFYDRENDSYTKHESLTIRVKHGDSYFEFGLGNVYGNDKVKYLQTIFNSKILNLTVDSFTTVTGQISDAYNPYTMLQVTLI